MPVFNTEHRDRDEVIRNMLLSSFILGIHCTLYFQAKVRHLKVMVSSK